MDIFGIGPLELLLIFVIILVVMGPTDIVKAGASLGKFFRDLMTSDTWKAVQQTSRSIRNLPNQLARQAGIEEMKEELNKDFGKSSGEKPRTSDEDLRAWTETPPEESAEEPNEPDAGKQET